MNTNRAVAADVVAITDLSADAAGAIILWRLSGDTNHQGLKAELEAAGLEKLVPSLPGNEVALRRAVKDQEQPRVLVRSLPAARASYAVVQETAHKENETNPLDYNVLLTVKLGQGGVLDFNYQYNDKAHAVRCAIEGAYENNKTRLSSNDTGMWLCRMVDKVRAVALRDTGGVYFVPRETLPVWRNIARALKTSSASYVAEIPAMRSTDSIDAVVDALKREVELQTTKVQEELAQQGDEALGSRALDTRADRLNDTMGKVEVYERLLGTTLDGLRDSLTTLQANVAAAALVARARAADEEAQP